MSLPPSPESIIVLDTPEAVQSFTKTQWAVDTDITGGWVGQWMGGMRGCRCSQCWVLGAAAAVVMTVCV